MGVDRWFDWTRMDPLLAMIDMEPDGLLLGAELKM